MKAKRSVVIILIVSGLVSLQSVFLFGQQNCVQCDATLVRPASIFVESKQIVPVVRQTIEYVEQTVCDEYVLKSQAYSYVPSSMVRVKPLGFKFDPECALAAAQEFQDCRAAGGRAFGCLLTAGIGYWVCSGSDFNSSAQRLGPVRKIRARMAGRRALRAARSTSSLAGCQ